MHAKDRVEVSKIWITGYWLWSWSSYICDCCKWMKNCRDSSLSLSGLEATLPAFQLPMFMFAKCDALPKAYFYNTVIVLSVVTRDRCKQMKSCRDWALSNSWLEGGLPAFQLPMFSKCDALPKGDLFNRFVSGVYSCLSLWDFQASTPYQKQVSESDSRLDQFLCIFPFVASAEKMHLSHAKKQAVWSRSCGLVQDLLQMQWLCSQLFCVTASNHFKPMNSCRDWAFSIFRNSGLEVGLPAFQLPMFSKCDSLRKRDFFDTFVQGIHSRQIPGILFCKDIQLMKRSKSR